MKSGGMEELLSSLTEFNCLIWFFISLLILLFLQRLLHRELQSFLMILTHNEKVTIILFSLFFLPGVMLHELSHLVTAKVLFVRTGKFSLIPRKQPSGKLRLGYVETIGGGFIRDAIIGAAPLVIGCIVIGLLVIYRLDLLASWKSFRIADWNTFLQSLTTVINTKNIWLWLYLIFVISNSMMPSQSDRHAWLPFGILLGFLIALVLVSGVKLGFLLGLKASLQSMFQSLAFIFFISCALHVILFIPIFLLRLVIIKFGRGRYY
jgi:hypothetical protein